MVRYIVHIWVVLTYTKTKFTLQTSFVPKVPLIWLYFELMGSYQTQTHLFSCFIYLLSFCRNCGALDVCRDRLYVTTGSPLTVSKSQFNNHAIMTYYVCYGFILSECVIIFATMYKLMNFWTSHFHNIESKLDNHMLSYS